ncbi:MAG: methylmalonyl-CoA mutase small subunit [Porphyromonas somerae]|uniref:methylmalonyl-CoA mutase small subunit n=1 Tax=Porphyromonas somerae TaxID=322095 RepID=UPI0026F13F81|nr:methylmalonyl-CoA mutase small subunit [Porphyromonas somerae]MDD7557962.1 methylmalonyl-CoA mutase small subunit [Porphyromonas somerae]MDY3884057.1 methylmalonyl-CoA mutase small subunit [Porphyromonas somerae]MDY5816381.1 methylmalonyl-CoA mutase small subunit [Porphyromonas somerae]
MKEKREKLFSEFPPVSNEEWMEVVTRDLKGAPFEKKLVWRTKEGFNVQPFYRAEDIEHLPTKDVLPGQFPYVRGTKADNSWLVRQDISVQGDIKQLNINIKSVMERGANSVGLHFVDECVNASTIQEMLAGIDLDKLEINLYARRDLTVQLIEATKEALKALGADLGKVRGSFGFNPFRHTLGAGVRWTEWVETSVEVLKAAEPLTQFTCLSFQSVDLVNAGAYIYQEIGYALAAGADMLTKVSEKSGKSISEVAERIRFEMGIGSNYFMEIAKFRAIRWLWALIVHSNDEKASDRATKAVVHAETSRWNKTIYDAYVNLLRSMTETMSATIAGVHSVTVNPFDKHYNPKGSDFSRRIARNQQLLLKEESHFDKVVDPAGGSYYIEHLTQAIAEQGWKLFLEVEEQGGFAKLANEGKVQEAVNASNEARHKAVATRRENLLGTNIFPNFTETSTEETRAIDNSKVEGKEITALDKRRGASDFEELRLATEASGKTPKVFMLTIGNLAMRLARSQFSSNFFGVAGYKLIDNLGFETVQEGVDAARKAGADIVVLCSSDDEYAEYGPQALEALKGEMPLVIAGAPACMEELQAKGIEHFVHVKANVLETMQKFNELMGIKPRSSK